MANKNQWWECPHGVLYRDEQKAECEICERDEKIIILQARVEALENHLSAAAPLAWLFKNELNVAVELATKWEKRTAELLKGE